MGTPRYFVVEVWSEEPAADRFRAQVRGVEESVGLCFRTPGDLCSFLMGVVIEASTPSDPPLSGLACDTVSP